MQPDFPIKLEVVFCVRGVKTLLWGNAAVLAAVLLAQSHQRQGKGMDLRSVLAVEDLPYFHYRDGDGEPVALPCAERLLTEAKAVHVANQGFMPILATRGRSAVRLAGFRAITGNALAGTWTPFGQAAVADAEAAAAAPGPATEPADEAAPSGEMALHDAIDPSRDPAPTGDDDLDALLAGLESDGTDEGAAETEMDPELAALLADL